MQTLTSGRRRGALACFAVAIAWVAGCGSQTIPPPMKNPILPEVVPPTPDYYGVYRLTFTAADSCQLPDEARHRTYTATIGGRAITLSGAQFYKDSYCGLANSFDAQVHGDTLSLGDWGGDCPIIEELGDRRYLIFSGTAGATLTDPILAKFNGSVSISPGPADGSKPIAECTSPDHQLLFERMLPTTGTAARIESRTSPEPRRFR